MSLRVDMCWVRDLDHLQLHQQLGLSHTCEPEQQLSLVHTVIMVLMFFCSIRRWWVMEEGVFYSVSPILMVPSTICQAIPQECLHQCLSSDFEIFSSTVTKVLWLLPFCLWYCGTMLIQVNLKPCQRTDGHFSDRCGFFSCSTHWSLIYPLHWW